ncbi:amidase [Rhodophyticola porphyridii]|uniref:amidase n=1 Tax=Rhodophyticola porphyridii TaxID=1852017 RepID=UPI0035CE9B36
MSDFLHMDAVELSRRMAAREVSAVEVMRATLARIDAVNTRVNAIVSLRDREALMGEARLADAMPREGWLHGMPLAVKDLVGVKGVRSTWGSPLRDCVPVADEALVTRLRRTGAIIIGKTNVPEFGLGSHSFNPIFGVTRNPYDLSRSAGGSSGGAAAALAMGMAPVADGSDMMGSLRNPAAWNNVYGFRPTAGLIPAEPGDSVFSHGLSTRGPMGRSVADVSALLETLTDGAFQPGPPPRKPPRIGWLGDWGGAYPMEEGVLDLAEGAVAAMRDLGWEVEPLAPPFDAAALWQSWTDLRSFTVALEYGADWRDPARRALLKPEAVWEIERGLALDGDRIETAAAIRTRWLSALEEMFRQIDALVLPSTQCWPFPAEWRWPQEIAGVAMDTYHRWMEVVVPVSLAGLPCLNLPAGFGAAGLPGGVQLIGPKGGDAAVLALGEIYHQATQWPRTHLPILDDDT